MGKDDNSLRGSGSSVKTHGKVKDRQAGAGVSQRDIVQVINPSHLLRIKKLISKAEKLYRRDAEYLKANQIQDYIETARAVEWAGRLIEKMERKS